MPKVVAVADRTVSAVDTLTAVFSTAQTHSTLRVVPIWTVLDTLIQRTGRIQQGIVHGTGDTPYCRGAASTVGGTFLTGTRLVVGKCAVGTRGETLDDGAVSIECKSVRVAGETGRVVAGRARTHGAVNTKAS